jgi:hypothetical protein
VELPYSQACENNKQPILERLLFHFKDVQLVFEIGTGTAQHAVHFAAALPHLIWQTADLEDNHFGINLRLEAEGTDNIRKPIRFKAGSDNWPQTGADAVFSANTAHIMQRDELKSMMHAVALHLPSGGVFCQYGPFNIDGRYTSESNQLFDYRLRSQGYGGICDIALLCEWTDATKLVLKENIAMPANNRLLVWQK